MTDPSVASLVERMVLLAQVALRDVMDAPSSGPRREQIAVRALREQLEACDTAETNVCLCKHRRDDHRQLGECSWDECSCQEFVARLRVRFAASRLAEGTRDGVARVIAAAYAMNDQLQTNADDDLDQAVCDELRDSLTALSTPPASPAATSAGPTVRDVEEVYGVSAASRPAQTWQPIESAPKDGSVILAWSPYWTHVRADVFWWTKRKAWNTAKPPTHWMPLPAPPGPGAQEQE